MLSQTRIPRAKKSSKTRDYLLVAAGASRWQSIRGEGIADPQLTRLFDDIYPSLYNHQRQIFIVVDGLEDWLRQHDWQSLEYQIIPLSDGWHGVKYLYRGAVWYLLEARAWFGEIRDVSSAGLLRLCERLTLAYDQQFSASPWEFFTIGALASHLFRVRYPQALEWWSNQSAPRQARYKSSRYAAYRAMRLGGVVRSRPVRLRGSFALYDAVSAYPNAALAIGKFPVPGSLERVQSLGNKTGFYHARIEWRHTPQQYPWPRVLPTFEDSSMVELRHGETYLTASELRLARKMGARVEIIEGWVVGRKTTTAPADFIRELLLARSEWQAPGELEMARHYKFLANAFIGKLGQSNANIADEGRRLIARYGTLHIPEWAALITGYARAAILGFANSWNWWHISTDSVLIGSDQYSSNWPEAYTYGGLTFAKQAEGDEIIVLNNNRYALYREGVCVKSALSGVPRTHHERLLEAMYAGEYVYKYNCVRPASLHDILSGTAKTLEEIRTQLGQVVLD